MSDSLEAKRYDALKEFWKDSITRFDQRRVYEWRMCFAIWTAFAAFAVGVLSGKPNVDWWISGGVAAIGFCFCLVHLYFLWHLHRRNNNDRLRAYEYAKEMRRIVGVELPNGLMKDIKKHEEQLRSNNFSWSHKTQMAFTILLYLSVSGVTLKSVLERGQSSTNKSAATEFSGATVGELRALSDTLTTQHGGSND